MTGSDLKTRVQAVMSYRSRKPAPQSSDFPADVLVALRIVPPLATGFAVTAIAKAPSSNASTAGGAAGSWPAISCVNASNMVSGGHSDRVRERRPSPLGKGSLALGTRDMGSNCNALRERSKAVVSIRRTRSPSFAIPCPPPRPMVALAKRIWTGANSANGPLRCANGGKWVAPPSSLN